MWRRTGAAEEVHGADVVVVVLFWWRVASCVVRWRQQSRVKGELIQEMIAMFGAEEDGIGGRGRGVHGVDRRLCSELEAEFDGSILGALFI